MFLDSTGSVELRPSKPFLCDHSRCNANWGENEGRALSSKVPFGRGIRLAIHNHLADWILSANGCLGVRRLRLCWPEQAQTLLHVVILAPPRV